MATIDRTKVKKCDICGQTFDIRPSDDLPVPNMLRLITWTTTSYSSGPIQMCCPDCMESILLHMDNLRKRTGDLKHD